MRKASNEKKKELENLFNELICARTKIPYSTYAKQRYWTGIFYTENMVEDWRERLASLVQCPFCAILHDKDVDSKGEHRKDHIHIMIVWKNSTTAKSVFKHFMQMGIALSANGNNVFGCATMEPVLYVRNLYDYFIHDTKEAREKKKYLYDASERIEGNNFDIGAYEELTIKDESELLDEICYIIEENNFQDFYELNMFVIKQFDIPKKGLFRKNQSYFKNIVEGKYKHEKRLKEEEQEKNKQNRRKEIENLKKEFEKINSEEEEE